MNLVRRLAGPHAERGSAMVEFAIVSTVALTLIFGIIDFGRALYTYHLVSNAARLGSRFAMVRGSACKVTGCPASTDDVQAYVRSNAVGVAPTSLAVTTTWNAAPGCVNAANHDPGCLVKVDVSYPFTFIVPLMPNFTLQMESESVMAISQ